MFADYRVPQVGGGRGKNNGYLWKDKIGGEVERLNCWGARDLTPEFFSHLLGSPWNQMHNVFWEPSSETTCWEGGGYPGFHFGSEKERISW